VKKGNKAVRSEHRTGQSAAAPASRGFWSSFTRGLGAVTMLQTPRFNPPRYNGKGLRGDWRVVGNDIRDAMRRLNDHKES
jgi:hypothetical protein